MGVLKIIHRERQLWSELGDIENRLNRMAFSWTNDSSAARWLAKSSLDRGMKDVRKLRNPRQLNIMLFRVLSNDWYELLRSQNQELSMDNDEQLNDYTSMVRHAHNDIDTYMRTEIARLPVRQRQAVTLVDIEAMSYVDVSKVLELPVNNVISLLVCARSNLRKALGPELLKMNRSENC